MDISDKIAIGIVAACVILSFTSFYKILVRLKVGLFLSGLVLLGLAIAAGYPKFDDATNGVFNGGKIFGKIHQNIDESPEEEYAIHESLYKGLLKE